MVFLWLLALFVLGVGLRLTSAGPSPAAEDLSRAPERLALLAQRLAPPGRAWLLDLARALETNPERQRILVGRSLPDSVLTDLPPGYRALAEVNAGTRPAELAGLVAEATGRLLSCLALLCALIGSALAWSIFARSERSDGARPLADCGPLQVVALFMAWDVLNLYLIQPLLGMLRPAVDSVPWILLGQAAGYAAMVLLLRRAGARFSRLGPPRFALAWVGRGYFACYALVLGTNGLVSLLRGQAPTSSNPLLELFMHAGSLQIGALALLVVVVGPAFEELMFRGWLLAGLIPYLGENRALAVSAALFAVIHGDPWATPALFVLGCVFGKVYLRTGSVYANILLHAMWNATTFSLLLASMP
jgi:membrane protease YdiL (CAAX protease family)